MELHKSDLEKIGHKARRTESGKLAIIASIDNAGVQQILLREILKLWDASIVEWGPLLRHENGEEKSPTDVEFLTDLFWKDYFDAFLNPATLDF
jgi:hypothetical protein